MTLSIPFIETNDQTNARHEHLAALRELVGNVYPNKFERSEIVEIGREDTISSVASKFRSLEPRVLDGARPDPEAIDQANRQLNKAQVRLAGRIASPPRVMGKAAFLHLSDGVSRLQLYLRRSDFVGLRNDGAGETVEGWSLF
jgi:lysyl-tRNA synthetase class II